MTLKFGTVTKKDTFKCNCVKFVRNPLPRFNVAISIEKYIGAVIGGRGYFMYFN